MNIQLEKENIVRQLMLVQDVDLIEAIKSLLSFGLRRERAETDVLDDEIPVSVQESIDISLRQLAAGEGIPFETAVTRIREKYQQ